jgi:ATP-binding cassette subfamily B protein
MQSPTLGSPDRAEAGSPSLAGRRAADASIVGARLRKFLSYYRPYRALLLADLGCAFVMAATALLLPVCANYVTKLLLAGQPAPEMLAQIWAVGGVMLGLVVVHTLCTLFVDYQGHLMGAKMERDMRLELFEHYQKLSFRFYDQQRTGQLMARITHDTFSLAELYHHGPEDLAIAVLKLLGVLAILAWIDVTLTLMVMGFLAAMLPFSLYFNRRMNWALRRSKDRIGDINERVEDSLAGVRVVKSFTNEGLESSRFARHNDGFLESRSDGYRSEAWFSGGMEAFTQLITIAVIVFGASAIAGESLDLADLVTFLLCIAVLVDPIKRFVNLARLYQEGITGFDRFMDVLEVEPDMLDLPDAVVPYPVRGRVKFRGVSFRYTDDAPWIVKDLSLEIEPGEFVAVVGSSGAGKTTLCSLIPRFYEVREGAILLDGIDVRRIRLQALRRSIGIVQQDVYLFSGSVADNLRYGRPDASHAEIVEAAKRAHAHAFIRALPRGYDTDIGERGVKLSGGQKQRLSIGRVFLKDPPVLIFDEATSALDRESEEAVHESLLRLARERTTLVIAHRLSTVRHAKRILVLADQGIAEEGTHEALLASDGAYARLYSQASI